LSVKLNMIHVDFHPIKMLVNDKLKRMKIKTYRKFGVKNIG